MNVTPCVASRAVNYCFSRVAGFMYVTHLNSDSTVGATGMSYYTWWGLPALLLNKLNNHNNNNKSIKSCKFMCGWCWGCGISMHPSVFRFNAQQLESYWVASTPSGINPLYSDFHIHTNEASLLFLQLQCSCLFTFSPNNADTDTKPSRPWKRPVNLI